VNLDELIQSRTLNRRDAARSAGISERQLHRAIQCGKLKLRNIGKVVERDDLEAFKRDYAPTRASGYVGRKGKHDIKQ
jgi:hypothetical protein